MKIYSMTATFGKLANQTLTFKPGLNVIHAPNEWGKSTWCAFMVAMLYGIDTRERTTQTTLADKERYAPWSGAPMSGRMDLCWNGKDITIERHTKGRTVFGEFRAYETASGLDVPELTATNCGQQLLGVEKTVFLRSAFIKLTDLPVTQDESLRRRLNALVTTGDENDAGDALAQKLKDLKNKCRHNKTGLLPQAEAQQKELTDKLQQLHTLRNQSDHITLRQQQLQQYVSQLENHQLALAFEASREDARRVAEANDAKEKAAQELAVLESACAMLPDRQTAELTLQQLRQVQTQQTLLNAETLPPLPVAPPIPAPFAGMDEDRAMQKAAADKAAYDMYSKPVSPVPLILAAVCLLAAIGLLFVNWYAAIPLPLFAVLFAVMHIRNKSAQTKGRQTLCAEYGDLSPEQWLPLAQKYQDDMDAYAESRAAYQGVADSIRQRSARLQESVQILTAGLSVAEAVQKWTSILERHEALATARETYRHAQLRAKDLAAVAKVAQAPATPDTLTLSPAQTAAELANATAEQRQLQLQLGQCMGQMESLGQEDLLLHQLSAVQNRIARLEETYSALNLALETLEQASQELQRRFAPRIAQHAQDIFSKLTGGRYDRLQLSQDLSIHAAAGEETTLHSAMWRSDGTADQLYLALRLAVSQALIPHAPLVLDDALVRFDDSRLALAMALLKELSDEQQVILFTCHDRETQFA